MKALLLLLFFATTGYQLLAQCTVTATSNNTTIPCGNCVTLSASGTAEGIPAFIEDFNDGNPTGWQFTQTTTIATNTCNVPSPDGTPFMWMGSASVNPRDMTTVGFDLTSGGTICFEMRYSIQGGTSPCEGPDLSGEGVYLQYSTNNGATWVTIQYWDPNGGHDPSLTSWGQYCFPLPAGARTANTQVRWHQDAVSGAAFDHWGIDNVEITIFGPPYQITWLHDGYSLGSGVMSGSDPTQVCLDSATTFNVVMTNGTHSCTSQVSVNIDYPHIDNIILNDPDCGNLDGTMQIQASGGIGGYQYSIDDSTTFQTSNLFGQLDGGTYYVVLVDQNDCHARDTAILVSVPPLVMDDSLINTSCGEQNGEISLAVSGGTPGYQYSINNGTTLQADSLFTQLPAGNYTIFAKDMNGCIISEAIVIDPSTNPVIDSLHIKPEKCGLQDAEIIAYVSEGIPAYTYALNNAPGVVSNTFSGLAGGSFSLVVTDQEGCTVDSVFTVGLVPPPVVTLHDSTLCGLTMQITGTNTATGSVWTSAAPGVSFSDQNAQNPVMFVNESGIYVINFRDTVCNVNEDFKVTFVPVPETAIADTILCVGETYSLVAMHAPQNESYAWNTGTTGPIETVTQTAIYIVTAINMCGIDIDSAFINMISCDLTVPNIFTPNGDGANDFFALVEYEGIEDFSCTILNRWGNVIREYGDVAFGWDGKDSAGNEVTEGTYFYIVKARTKGDRKINKQGMVQLVRDGK